MAIATVFSLNLRFYFELYLIQGKALQMSDHFAALTHAAGFTSKLIYSGFILFRT
jgi:hypothetical protein